MLFKLPLKISKLLLKIVLRENCTGKSDNDITPQVFKNNFSYVE